MYNLSIHPSIYLLYPLNLIQYYFKWIWQSTWAGVGVAVSCLNVRSSAAATPMLWCWWVAESFSSLDTRITLRWTLRPLWPDWPTTMHWKHTASTFQDLPLKISGWRISCMCAYIWLTWTEQSAAWLLLLTVSITERLCVCVVKHCECVIAAAKSSSYSNVINMAETCFTALWPAGPLAPRIIW